VGSPGRLVFIGLFGQEFSDFFFQVLACVLMGDPASAVEQEQARDVAYP